MIKNFFHEKVSLLLSFLILSNYLFLSLNFPEIIIKINFVLFLVTVLFFYFNNLVDNFYLKLFFLLMFLIALGTPTYEWDPRSIWLFHAKRIFYDGSIFSVADNYASFSHNEYPNLVPAFSSSLATLLGYWNEVLPKLSFLFMYLPPLILSFAIFKNEKYIIFLSLVFFFIGKYLINGWADGLVAVYFSLSALLMYLLIIENQKNGKDTLYFLLAFCFFVILTLIKNEGIALLLILFVVTFFIIIFKGKLKNNIYNLFYLSFSFIPIILWKYFCFLNGIENDYINSNFFVNLLPRISDFENIKLIGYFIFLNEKFLISLVFLSIVFWIRKNSNLLIYVFTINLLYILIISLIFLATPVDFYFQLDSAAARIVKSINFCLAFFALYNLNAKNVQLSK